jgi:sugar lactone lactonase YvrE
MTCAYRWIVLAVLVGGLSSGLAGCGACGTPDETVQDPLGELIGRIVLDDDVGASGCMVTLEGSPRGARCDQAGEFAILAVDPGRWVLRVVADRAAQTGGLIPDMLVTTAANAGIITPLGNLRVAKPGSLGGHAVVPAGQTPPFTILSIPGYGISTALDPTTFGYLFERVPAGVHDVVLTNDSGSLVVEDVQVRPGVRTLDVDFDLAAVTSTMVAVIGEAAVSQRTDRAGITVELVDAVDGTVEQTVVTGDDGTFSLPARAGVYLVRARHPSVNRTAVVPSVLVYGTRDLVLASALVIPSDLDLDGDGLTDDLDDDDDGDGVLDGQDGFPQDPAESLDSDGDGVGDNADLDRDGNGTVDRAVPTPDGDGDGQLDFEDNCPATSNPDQVDTDGDGVGTLCDNCPGVVNPDQADGDSDGQGDACEACIPGSPCAPVNSCNVGLLLCSGATPVCQDSGQPRPDGSTCGLDQVCFAGACAPCQNGGSCFTSSAGACVVGVQSCASGQAECLPTAAQVPSGNTCGLDQVCDDGACVACTEGGACTYAPNACRQGRLSCDTGLPQTCEDSGLNAADGTNCGGANFCRNGSCEPCNQGQACSPASAPCHVGAITCGTGSATCEDQGSNAPDGSPCLGAGMYCSAGACITSPNTLTVTAGGGQTAPVGSQLAPITVRLRDGGGTALVGRAVTVVPAPGGTVVTPASTTDATGASSFVVRLGPTAGVQTFSVQTPVSAPLELPFSATASPAGTIFTVVNASHTSGFSGVPGPASQARIGDTGAMALGPDGSVYLAEQFGGRLYRVDPAGTISHIAGQLASRTPPWNQGDPALTAYFGSIDRLAFDASGQLYVVTSDRIGRLDLASGRVFTYAGGGPAGPPGYGDGGLATAARLQSPTSLAFGPGGVGYLFEQFSGAVRRIDAAGVITTILSPGTNCVDAVYVSAGSGGALVVGPTGALFLGASVCVPVTQQISNGLLRRDPDGTVHHIAGDLAGTLGEGAHAAATQFLTITGLAFDPAGNLFTLETQGHRVRRIDARTGLVSRIAGTGTSGSAGEYVTAATAPLSAPVDLVVRGADLWISEGTATVRQVSGVTGAVPGDVVLSLPVSTASVAVHQQVASINARVATAGGTPYLGLPVTWASPQVITQVVPARSLTNTAGLAPTTARTGLVPGTTQVLGSYRDLHGTHVAGSPATFTITNTSPTGTVLTAVNLVGASSAAAHVGVPAALAGVQAVAAVAVASTGAVYFGDTARVHRLDPTGLVTTVAGGGNALGDFGPAVGAQLSNVVGLALDEAGGRLYISERNSDRVRRVDLATGIIVTQAGGGAATTAPWGDGGLATNAVLATPAAISLGPDGALYIADTQHARIRRVDLTTNVITTALVAATSCDGLSANVVNLPATGGAMVWSGTDLYVGAVLCRPGSTTSANGILRRDAGGTLTVVAGGPATGPTADGTLATAAGLGTIQGLTLVGGDLVFTDGNRIRRITGGVLATLAGSGTAGVAGEYGPPLAAQLENPRALAATPSGRIYFGEASRNTLRVLW